MNDIEQQQQLCGEHGGDPPREKSEADCEAPHEVQQADESERREDAGLPAVEHPEQLLRRMLAQHECSDDVESRVVMG